MKTAVTTFYRFTELSDEKLSDLSARFESFASERKLQGLCLLGHEGINATVSGPSEAITDFKMLVCEQLGIKDVFFKDSWSSKKPFPTFKVKIKDEIVTMRVANRTPASAFNSHMSPKDWHKALQDPETVVIDTRNDYEIEIGKFKSAIDFKLKEFGEFPERLKNSELDKNKRVLIYCTGGIRCEKASLEMQAQGFTNVHQLEGGILNYLSEFPEQEFTGECFVFDHRVAVDQKLNPTEKYSLCPHCGQPANQQTVCVQCHEPAILCSHCTREQNLQTCSKNCEHHRQIGSRSSRRQVLAR
jgi:UPF0176 protein